MTVWQELEMYAGRAAWQEDDGWSEADDPRRWAARAACASADPDLFYDRTGWHLARRLCDACPVLTECRADVDMLEAAMWRSDWSGLWANEDPDERALRRGHVIEPKLAVVIGSRQAKCCAHSDRVHFTHNGVRLCTARRGGQCPCRTEAADRRRRVAAGGEK